MFGIKRLFGRKTENPTEQARQRFAQAEAEFFRGVDAEMRRFSQQAPAQLIEGDAADRRIAAMTIAFDPDGNSATDTTSGMALAYIRDDYPLERGEFWGRDRSISFASVGPIVSRSFRASEMISVSMRH